MPSDAREADAEPAVWGARLFLEGKAAASVVATTFVAAAFAAGRRVCGAHLRGLLVAPDAREEQDAAQTWRQRPGQQFRVNAAQQVTTGGSVIMR